MPVAIAFEELPVKGHGVINIMQSAGVEHPNIEPSDDGDQTGLLPTCCRRPLANHGWQKVDHYAETTDNHLH
jgi:hypothetical protein